MIFQDTSRLKLQWQSSLPTALQEEWNSWVDLMQSVGDISVSRCLVPPQLQDGVFELHVFSDASTKAYGSVVYLRCLNKLGQIHFVLVCSKNRVAPLKVTTTIPRMELQSAVLSSVLARVVMNALTVQLLPTSYWTDSMITLGFIKNTHRRFHTYVANRINKIRQTTHPEQWFFVPGESNPADLLTRKKLPAQLDQNIWNNGPTFLSTNKDTWNFIQNSNPSLPDSHPDIKAEPQISMVVVAKREPMDLLID